MQCAYASLIKHDNCACRIIMSFLTGCNTFRFVSRSCLRIYVAVENWTIESKGLCWDFLLNYFTKRTDKFLDYGECNPTVKYYQNNWVCVRHVELSAIKSVFVGFDKILFTFCGICRLRMSELLSTSLKNRKELFVNAWIRFC